MTATETATSRVLVGRIQRGESLTDALEAIVEMHGVKTAWISALGAFEWVDLVEYDQDTRRYGPPMRVERCELLAMVGNCSERDGKPWWHLHATVSHVGEGRDKVYGGHVTGARVFAFEYRIDCFDGLALRREADEPTGLVLWPVGVAAGAGSDTGAAGDTAAATDAATDTATGAWAAAAEASQQAIAEDLAADSQPVQGDYIEHGKFGLCRVDLIKGDTMIIKLPDARRKKLKVSFMRFSGRRSDGKRTIHTAEKR